MQLIALLNQLQAKDFDSKGTSTLIDLYFRVLKQFCAKKQATDSRVFLLTLKGLNKMFS